MAQNHQKQMQEVHFRIDGIQAREQPNGSQESIPSLETKKTDPVPVKTKEYGVKEINQSSSPEVNSPFICTGV